MKSVSSIVNEMDMSETVEYLLNNESSFIVSQDDINKIKADAVDSYHSELLKATKFMFHPHLDGVKCVWLRKLERGEHE